MAYWWLLLGVLPLTALPLLFPVSLLVLLDLSRPLSTLLGCWSVYRGNPSPSLCPASLSESLSLDLASLAALLLAVREFAVLYWSRLLVWSLDRYQDLFDFASPQYKLLLAEVLPAFSSRYVGYYQRLVDDHLSLLVNETSLLTSQLHNPLPALVLNGQIQAWKNFALTNNLTIPFHLPPSPFVFTPTPPLPYTQSVPAGFVSVLMLSILVVCFLCYQYGASAPTDLIGADDLSIVAGTALGPAALAPLANNINAKLKRERARPYVLPDSLLPLAASHGLDHNPHGAKYTHPFHYYANEKLRDHAAGYHKGNSVTVMFMKDRLFPAFTASPGSRLVNFILTPADIVRYSRGHAQFPILDTQGLHIDFALHHLPQSFFSAIMASNPTIVITATGAFPIEARYREPSVHPEYTLLYGRDRFTYLPENLVGDFYEHTYESLEWMTTKSISNGTQIFGVSRVASVSACELYVMSACTISEQYRPYDLANCILIPLWYLPLTSRATRLLPLTLANSLDAFSDRWGTGVYTDYSTKAGQSTVLDATKYTRGQMRLASHFAWLFGNRFEFFDSPSLLFRIIGGIYWMVDIISLGSFHSQLFNKDKTFVQLETKDVFARPYIPQYLRELSMVQLPSYALTGSGLNGPVFRAWLISSFMKTLASKRIFLFVLYHSPSLVRQLISFVSAVASLFSIPLSDFSIIVLFVVFFSLPSYIYPLHGWSFVPSDYFPLPEGFTVDHLLALVAQHPAYRSGNFPADIHQYLVISLLLTSSMTGILPGYVTGILLGFLFVYLCGFAALCAGFLTRFARPIQPGAPFFEVRALFPYMNLDLVPASLICNMRSGQIHDLQPPLPPPNPILPLPGNAIPPLAPVLPPMPLPVLPALAQGRPYAPAFPANVPAGTANHPLRAYFYRPNVVDAPGLVAQLAALPPPIIPYQPSMSCFYNSIGAALGVDGNAIRHAYLASLPTGQIMNYHLYGFVLDNDIRSASAFFGFGIRLLDQANVVQYEQPARDNLPVIDLVLTTIRNVRHIALPRRNPLPAHAAVAQLPVLNAQPSLIGAGRGIDWVLRNAAAAVQVVTNPFTPVPNQNASASKYRYGLSNVHSSFGNALFSLMGLPGPSSSGSVFERDFQLPPTAANFAPITWAGPVELSVSDLGLHTLDLNRASALASALRDGPTIWQAQALSPTWHKCQKQFMRMPCSTSVRLVGLFGCSGCGKTTFVRNNPDMYDNYLTYAWFPSAELMQEAIVADMLNGLPDSHYISDFEVFRKTDAECLILDDFGTCLPGTLDWLIAVSPNLKLIILTGDPTQGKAAWPTEGTRVSGLSFEADYVMSLHGQQISYCNITRRLSKAMASMAGLYAHPSCSDDGNLVLVNHFPDQVPVFVASPRFRTTITAGGVYAYTMSCSQGLSLDKDICVDSGGMSQMMTDNIISMVLCRGKRNVLVRYDHQGMAPAGYRFAASEILSAIIAAAAASGSSVLAPHVPETQAIRHAFMRHYARNLPANLFVGGVAEANLLIGATESSLPASSSDVLREVRLHYPQVSLTRAQPAPTTSQRGEPDVDIFVSDPSILPVPPLDREPAQVERVVGDSATYQLKPEIPVTLHHRRSDDATTAISYDKRIHVATAASNASQIKDTPESDGLRSTFIRLFGPSHTFNEVAYQLCLERVLDSWLSKRTLSAALRYLKDLDVDLPSTHISTFLKGQVLKKLEKANKEASPGQIVSAPPFIRNMIDAAYALYIEDFLLAAAPPRVYLHLRRTPSSLLSWRSSIGRVPAKFTEIDYAAWDSGVDGKFLTFDIWLFRWFGFCAAYIGFYVYCRINSFFFRGVIGLMQLSGDRYTFLLNTLHNLLLTFLIYNISLLVWIMFAGDDVLIFGWLFAVITHLHFKMNPKTKHSTQGHFCGYMITETGIHAHAQVLFLRFMIAVRTRPTDRDYFRSLVDLLVDLPVITHSPYTSTLLPHVQYHLVKLNMVEDARRLSVYGRISPFAVPFQVVLDIFYSFKLFPSRIIGSAPAPKFKFRLGSFLTVILFFLSMFVLFATVLFPVIKNPINLKHSPSPLLTISMSTNVAQTSLAAAAPVALSVGPSAPSSMLLRPQSFDPVLTFTGTVKLTEQHKVARFDFRSMQSFQQRVAVFESVLLRSVFFKAGISPGTTGLVQYGVDGNHANPTEISSCAIYDFFGGGSMGMASQLFELGASSRFGRELKAPVLGNPTPVFHIGVDGLAAGQYVVLHFRVEVEVAGNAPPVTIAYQHIAPDSVHADVERIEQPQAEDAVAQSAT